MVASEDNDFWKSFVPSLDKLPGEFAKLIRESHTGQNGHVSMEPFFDMLAIHELGHAYHKQHDLHMQRNWLSELFVNIFLHTYIAEKEPQYLPALTSFPKMVVVLTDRSALKYTSLADLETYYSEIAQQHPRNYGWYQCRWHMGAATIYDKGGLQAFKRFWKALDEQKERINDPELTVLLAEKADPSVADVLRNW